MKKFTWFMALSFIACSANNGMAQNKFPVPPTQPDVVDDYFGIQVRDIYRPLENDTAPETLKWVEEENKLTEEYLSKIPYRNYIKNRLTHLNNYKKTGLPVKKKDGKYYFFENDGLKNQSVLFRSNTLDGEAEIVLDPNAFSEDGTVALQSTSMSNDGKYMAYIVSRSGSDWNEIYVLDLESGKLLEDKIEWVKFSQANWKGDGFYYSAYPKPEKGKEYSNTNENHQIYFHKLGTPQEDDVLIFEDKAHPLRFHTAYVPESEDYLFVYGSGEGNGNSLMFKDLKNNSDWIIIEPTQDYELGLIEVEDGKAYAITNLDSPKYKLIAIDLSNPAKENWTEIIPQSEGVLTGAQFSGNDLLVNFEKDASDHIYLYSKDGNLIREIELPTFGSVGVSASKDDDEIYYVVTSFVYPAARFSYDKKKNESSLLGFPDIDGFDFDDYVTEQVFYPSTDGTLVPMFITYKKGLKRDGNNPVYLYGYGGFNVSLTPGFTPNRLFWLENGGIYAQTNLRGGSEYGKEWHEAGTKLNKKNVFNDFISAAEYMIQEGWTTPANIVIEGGSNGGLLVGASVNMRPDLFAVAIPRVGVMDMMRYHLFTIGWNWAPDYGTSADSKEMAEYLLSYSPVHNIKNDGTKYPAILVTTADHDDRVVPAHSFKYAAALQAADTGDAVKLIRIDSKAGHGGGKPLSKVIDEYTDLYSFILYNLGRTPVVPD